MLGLAGCNILSPAVSASFSLASFPAATPEARATSIPLAAPTLAAASLAAPTSRPSPSPMPSPTVPVCHQTQGTVEENSLDSQETGGAFPYRIYLPPCYNPHARPGYPVLYLIHGMGSSDDQWDRMGADETADQMIRSGKLSPFLIVMPYDAQIDYPEQDPFDEALLEELIPWVDGHYASRATSQYRAVGGLSRGAAWALHLGLAHPDVFGAIGLHSLPIFWSDAGKIPQMLDSVPLASMPRMYLDIGRGDSELSTVQDFESLLTQRNIPHEWHLNNGYHEEAYWSAHLDQYFSWYAAGWKSP